MPPSKPMLDDVELQQVQKIDTEQDQVLTQHGVPALEGDFFQGLGRRATRVTLTGVMTGPEAGEGLKTLRSKFRAADPVSFVADIATATKVDQVLIEEMGVRELAGKSERFEYALTLREFIPPPRPEVIPPPPPPPPPPPSVTTGTLVVEVIVEGQPNFDFSTVTVTVEGTQENGTPLPLRTLTNRANNIWTELDFPPGQYTARAVVLNPQMSGSAEARVRAGQTTRATIVLRPGAVIAKAFIVHFWFDKAFVEPCMRHVLQQVSEYAQTHPDEKLVIVGHTDKVGSDQYNQSLSERRGRSVFACLTFGRDPAAALAEWNALRVQRPAGELPSIKDSWGTREYQYMLQDLGFYPGNVDGDHGPLTDDAVRTFQRDRGLTVDGIVGNATWAALIEAYLSQDALAVPESQLLPNCPGEVFKWLGCGEQDPVRNTEDAWRPNRRTELLFVKANALPCQVPQPDTFDLPSPGAVNNSWCLGPGDPNARCCFITRDTGQPGKWLVQPAEPGTVIVRGSIKFEDGTPAANVRYVLIAPDGEFMDGERPRGPDRGRPIPGRTAADGTFAYPNKPKGIGVYTLELEGPFVARLADEPPEAAKGNVVCKRLDGSSDFDVVVCQAATTFDLQVSGATQVGGPASTTFLATRATSGDVIVTAVFPPGTCAAPRSITWTGGEELPDNPRQRRVSRATTGQTTVTATMTSSGVTRSVDIFVVRVTLDVDADRDGMVEEDAAGKSTWEFGVAKKGAVILCNNDDDNSNAVIDNQNSTIDGAGDVNDLALLVIRRSGLLPAGVSLELSVSDQQKIKVFDQRSATGTAVIGPSPLPAEFMITTSTAADVEFGMEAMQYPDDPVVGFNGLVRLTLALKDGTTELARDEVLVRVAAWVLPSHLDVTEELYVVEIPGFNTAPASPFIDNIQAAATAAGVPLRRASGTTYGNDQWVQDSMEVGYSRIPGQAFSVVLNAVNRRDLDSFAPDELLGPDYGLFQPPFNLPPDDFNTFDSHGNIEVSPPVKVGSTEFKFGRIYHGQGRPSTPFSSNVKAFLEAQLVQKPFELDTDWLGVGHVDEIMSFVPSNVGKGFRMLFASTDEAIRILTDLRNAGHGSLTLFTGKFPSPPADHFRERTIDDILGDAALKAGNDSCQARLNGVLGRLHTELGVDPASDVIMIPSLFIEEPLFPGTFAALIPGMVNLLVITRPSFADTQLVLPKPFGPILAGVDQLEEDVRDKLAPLGYMAAQIHFVDDFDTYHINLGEVHCGTNSKRRPHTTPWWEQTDF